MLHDEETKRKRGYVERGSIVRYDGCEILVGRDWRRRKEELAARSGGICEAVHNGVRCRSLARDPHHKIERSEKRDDRLDNLLHLCGPDHDAVDWKKLHWSKNEPKVPKS
jgi:hypothetical protein